MVLGHWLSTNSLLRASSSQIEFGMERGGDSVEEWAWSHGQHGPSADTCKVL